METKGEQQLSQVWSLRGRATHLVIPGAGADNVWESSLGKVEQWMVEHHTDPNIRQVLIDHLKEWRSAPSQHCYRPCQIEHLATAAMDQNNISWQRLLEGWLQIKWRYRQQQYYSDISSKRSGKCWVVSVIKVWDVDWDLWEHRNQVLHNQDNIVRDQSLRMINRHVTSLFKRLHREICRTLTNTFYIYPYPTFCASGWITK